MRKFLLIVHHGDLRIVSHAYSADCGHNAIKTAYAYLTHAEKAFWWIYELNEDAMSWEHFTEGYRA